MNGRFTPPSANIRNHRKVTIMNPPTYISSLPPELMIKICRDSTLQKKDLIALRLTNKSQGFHLFASEEFAKRYLTNISLFYTSYSLQTFAKICSDHGCFHKVFSTISTMRLEKLTLTNIDLDRFKPFKRRIKSLRHLELHNCEIEGSLKDVLLSIQRNVPQLEYFRLTGITRQWLNHSVKLKGAQGVQDGINKLIQSRQEYLDNPGWTIPWYSDED
jgi:hypothetical protein